MLKFARIALFLFMGVSAAALAGPVTETRLSNGLRVIVREDHRAPVVVSQIWYRVGSIDESTGTTGVAHALEHMMFKGTKAVPAGQFSRIIAAAGGQENAFTSSDSTAYFQQLRAAELPLAFKLEADRMRNLTFSQAEFAKEIKVVMEERRWRTEDQAQGVLRERFNAAAFDEHPYHNPIIGWMNDLQHMTVGDVEAWYRRWYTPQNAVLVVVGDVKAADVFALARRYFGPVPARSMIGRKPLAEPAQRGIKRLTVKAPAEQPALIMGYHVPVLRNAATDVDPYALEMLAGVLDADAASRLTRELVRAQQVAADVGAGYDSIARGPGLFILEGTPSTGKNVAELEQALRGQIEKIKRDGVTEDELTRIKAQLVAGEVYKLDSMFYQAMEIGQMEMSGLSYRDIDMRLEKLKAVTAEQVQQAARKYLVDDQLTVAVLDPQPLDPKSKAAPPADARHLR